MLNQPTPGVTGPDWRGHSSTYVEARDEYSAIHFHDDDLEDAGWEVGVELDLEPELEPGIYAARLVSADCEDLVPFYVTAPRVATADALLLLPTLTYLAYANEHEILSNPPSYTAFTGSTRRTPRWAGATGSRSRKACSASTTCIATARR